MDVGSAEYLAALIDQRDLNLNTWNFFVSVHLALGGALIIVQRKIFLVEKLLVSIGYLVFMAMTYSAQLANYAIYSRMIRAWEEVHEAPYLARGVPISPGQTLKPMQLPFLDTPLDMHSVIGLCFAMCGAGMLLLIFNVNRLARKN